MDNNELEPSKTPTLGKVIGADYLAWLCISIPVVFWTLFIVLRITRATGEQNYTLLAPALFFTLAGALVLVLRYRSIRGHFEKGVEVPGKVLRVMNIQDLGRVIYTFTYLTKQFQATSYFHFTTRMEKLVVDDTIVVVINPADPRKALIKDLYFTDPGMEE